MNVEPHDPAEQQRYEAVQALEVGQNDAVEPLVRALYDGSWRVRKLAAEKMRRLPDPTALVPRLVTVLGDRGETGARNAAAEALVLLGRQSVPAVVELLAHPDPDQRKFAADILGPIGHQDAEEALVRALEDPDPNVRVSVAEALGQVGGASAPRALEHVLASADTLLRLSALEALTRLGAPPPLPVLVTLAREAPLRRAATRTLGLIRQPAALKEIARALLGDARVVREAAIAALGLQTRGATPQWCSELEREVAAVLQRDGSMFQWFFLDALELEDLEARRGALFALGLLPSPNDARRIAEAAEDDRLAEDALRALVRKGPAAARSLAGELETLSAPAQLVAAEALVQLSEPSLVPAFETLTRSGEPELQLLAVKALGRSRAPDASQILAGLFSEPALAAAAGRALVELARSFPAEVRAALDQSLGDRVTAAGLRALAATGGADVVKTLRRTSRDPEAQVRAASAEAAGELAGEGASELLRIALSDENAQVRASAARVLGRLPSAEALPLIRLALADSNLEIVAAAIEAAADARAPELTLRLRELAGTKDALTVTRALRTLSQLGELDAATLGSAIRHPEPEVVREALIAGATLPEAVGHARELLAHPRWDLRASAARVLGSSGGADALHAVSDALAKESDALVREALEEARAQLRRR